MVLEKQKNQLLEIFSNAQKIWNIVWKKNKKVISLLALFSVFVSLAGFALSGVQAYMINILTEQIKVRIFDSRLVFAMVLSGLAGLFVPLLYSINDYFSRILWLDNSAEFEQMLLKKKGEMDIATHEDPKLNDLMNKVNENGIYRIQNFIARQFGIMQNILEFVIGAGIILSFNPWIFLAIAATTIPAFLLEVKYGNKVWGIHSSKAEIRRKYWEIRRHFNFIGGLTELKVMGNTEYFLGLAKNLFNSFLSEEKKVDRKRLNDRTIATIVSQIAILASTVYFLSQTVQGSLKIGTFLFVISSIGGFKRSLASLCSSIGQQYQDSLFISDVFEFLDLPQRISVEEKGVILDQTKPPVIEFRNVSFRYPETEKYVLKNISFTIKSGEKIAFVGENGAGKSTILKLLCRFYDVTEGEILVNGYDLKEIFLPSWYGMISALFQSYSRYRFTAKEAIAIGNIRNPIETDSLRRAAETGECDAFINSWEKRYDQQLGKEFTDSIEPSDGQWHKMTIARTFYPDSKVMILDEPTSDIDAQSEANFFEKFPKITSGKSVILISHKFSTVRKANRIFVIENGMISESGSHQELMEIKGTYRKLFDLQAFGYHTN